jgi:uncharacterized metal-binding protein YceD (DUF177 family)
VTGRSAGAREFSRPLKVEEIGNSTQRRTIEAKEAERQRLAERFGLLALDRLSAEIELRRQAGNVIHAEGRLVADVIQSCVVTLEPVPAHIEADFACSFEPGPADDADIDPLAGEEIEFIEDGQIDLGETVAQQLAVALDPYPRAPGAQWPEGGTGEGPAAPIVPRNPFAKLEKLKKP